MLLAPLRARRLEIMFLNQPAISFISHQCKKTKHLQVLFQLKMSINPREAKKSFHSQN